MKKIALILSLLAVFPSYALADISFGSATVNDTGGLTQSFSVSGDNPYLLVAVRADDTIDSVSGVTYNGTSMTLVDKGLPASGRYSYLFYLANPDSGTHDVVVSNSMGSIYGMSVALYTGVSNEAPEAHYKVVQDPDAVTHVTGSVTTLTSNAWVVAVGITNDTYVSADGGTTARTTNREVIHDSGALYSPGSHGIGFNIASDPGNAWVWIGASLVPAGGPPPEPTPTPTYAAFTSTSSTPYIFLITSYGIFLIELFGILTLFYLCTLLVGWPIKRLARNFVRLIKRGERIT